MERGEGGTTPRMLLSAEEQREMYGEVGGKIGLESVDSDEKDAVWVAACVNLVTTRLPRVKTHPNRSRAFDPHQRCPHTAVNFVWLLRSWQCTFGVNSTYIIALLQRPVATGAIAKKRGTKPSSVA